MFPSPIGFQTLSEFSTQFLGCKRQFKEKKVDVSRGKPGKSQKESLSLRYTPSVLQDKSLCKYTYKTLQEKAFPLTVTHRFSNVGNSPLNPESLLQDIEVLLNDKPSSSQPALNKGAGKCHTKG